MLPFQPEKSLNMTWEAEGFGSLELKGHKYKADFELQGVSIHIEARDRRAWNQGDLRAGPEGWLGVPLAATGSLSLSGGGAHWQLPAVSAEGKGRTGRVYRR